MRQGRSQLTSLMIPTTAKYLWTSCRIRQNKSPPQFMLIVDFELSDLSKPLILEYQRQMSLYTSIISEQTLKQLELKGWESVPRQSLVSRSKRKTFSILHFSISKSTPLSRKGIWGITFCRTLLKAQWMVLSRMVVVQNQTFQSTSFSASSSQFTLLLTSVSIQFLLSSSMMSILCRNTCRLTFPLSFLMNLVSSMKSWKSQVGSDCRFDTQIKAPKESSLFTSADQPSLNFLEEGKSKTLNSMSPRLTSVTSIFLDSSKVTVSSKVLFSKMTLTMLVLPALAPPNRQISINYLKSDMRLLKSSARFIFIKNKNDLRQASIFFGFTFTPPPHLPSALTQLPQALLYQKLQEQFKSLKDLRLDELSQLCQTLLWANILDIDIWSDVIKRITNSAEDDLCSLSVCIKCIKTYVCNYFKLQKDRVNYHFFQGELSRLMSQEQLLNLVSKAKRLKENRIPNALNLILIHQKFSRVFDTKFNQIKEFGEDLAFQSQMIEKESVSNLLDLFKIFSYVGANSDLQRNIIHALKPKVHQFNSMNFFHLAKCSQSMGEFDPFFKPHLIESVTKQAQPTNRLIGIANALLSSGVEDQQIYTILTQKINNQKFLNRLNQLQLKSLHIVYHHLRLSGFKSFLKNQYELSQACRLCQTTQVVTLLKERKLQSDCLKVETPINKNFTTFKNQQRKPHYLQNLICQQLKKLKDEDGLEGLKIFQSVKLCTYETDILLQHQNKLIALQISSNHYLNNQKFKGKKNLKFKMLDFYNIGVLSLSTRDPTLLQLTKSRNNKPFLNQLKAKLQSIH